MFNLKASILCLILHISSFQYSQAHEIDGSIRVNPKTLGSANTTYVNYHAELSKLIPLNEDDLNKALPGRQSLKYTTDTLTALPFEGISVIHNIPAEEADRMKLSTMALELKQRFFDKNLGHMIAFVDLHSFHATTFDLINEPETFAAFAAPTNIEEYKYQDVRDQIEKMTQKFLLEGDGVDYNAPCFESMVRITSVGMFAPGIVKLNLTKDNEQDTAIFKEFREKLQAYLLKHVPGYSLVRQHVGPLSSHITIGYVMNKPQSVEDVDAFVEVLREINSKFEPGGEFFDLNFMQSQGELTGFTNMDHYYPLFK